MEENDYFEIKFYSLGGGQATIYIVKEGPTGNIEYIPDHEFQPKSNLTYQFLLQKLQVLDE